MFKEIIINQNKILLNFLILFLYVISLNHKTNDLKNKLRKNISEYETYDKNFTGNSTCDLLDPINLFNLRLKNGPIEICNQPNTKHICYSNNNGTFNDILMVKNGLICIMENIIIDPSKSKQTGLIYKGPCDHEHKGYPILSKGFIKTKCTPKKIEFELNEIYESYLNSWDYDYNVGNESLEELSPGKTLFLLSRNQDSPNLYHGSCEIINVISMLYLFNLSPEEVQVLFMESIEIPEDPFYDLYKYIISRGGKPLYLKNLKKKYKISKAIHVPIILDSTAFTFLMPFNCSSITKTYQLYNDLVDKYLNIYPYKDKFISENQIFYYPEKTIKNHEKNINFTKIITIQWRRLWPKGRKSQTRLLDNGPQLASKLAYFLPNNFLVRLINTAALSIEEQISVMRSTDYLIGIHGAGLSLSIFLPKRAIYHEISKSKKRNLIRVMSSMSGHISYSDIIKSSTNYNDGNENLSFDEDEFSKSVLSHMKQNNFFV